MIVESYEDVVILSGDLRSNFWDTVHTAISLTLKRHPSGVIIDCSDIGEVSPAGAETFRSILEFVQNADARVIVAAVPTHVMEVLRSVPEVRSQLPIAKTVEEARSSLDLLDHPSAAPKKRGAKAVEGTLLACVTGCSSDDEMVRLGRDLALQHNWEALMAYPLLVPRDLPLQAPLAEEESVASAAIERARSLFEEAGIPTRATVERARDVASALSAALEDEQANLVLVGLPDDAEGQDRGAKLVRSVLAKMPETVIFVRGVLTR